MAGRKPKPTALKKLEGNPEKRKMNTNDYSGAAEPPVRSGESHLSGLTEPPHIMSYFAFAGSKP